MKELLEEKVEQFNVPDFILVDPISIPHQFSKKQDIEIAGLFAAILAWGQRKTIVRKCNELLGWMDQAPHEFIVGHSPRERVKFQAFAHRTFNGTDTVYFLKALQHYYKNHDSLEWAFHRQGMEHAGEGLIHFRKLFFSLPTPGRTYKHISSPESGSTCKRLNMYLRWMVRRDNKGVDFGIWRQLLPSQLLCPCDVHVERIARSLGLIKRKKRDWLTVLELTSNLRALDNEDPVKYDFALFGMGVTRLSANYNDSKLTNCTHT